MKYYIVTTRNTSLQQEGSTTIGADTEYITATWVLGHWLH